MKKMRRDDKGRFTKALVKTRPQLPTDVQLERKIARIEESERSLELARFMLVFNAAFVFACATLFAIGPIVGSLPVSVIGGIGFFLRVDNLKTSNARYWKYRATHQRLLKGADSLTNKLLVEEGVVSPPDNDT